ncbi:minor capsid protein [Clostridium sp. OS1-26]|uniref:minor capsid protein n=1 Tax=Clostridium sp. OS1-26 TaxID=3070681 RepID=UPI0027E0D082|nr:minor capsid protein [Clostridium sp. OS1-26]WML35355.1 minor capsid protein [Clostridium sp. OS1-26]
MKSRDYWKKRSEEVAAKQFKKTDDYLFSMQLEYQEALSSIQKDIEVFYARFAQNNEISLADARQLLNSNQLKEFKMSLEEFTQKAKNNKNQQWEKELNNVSYKVRITRLQALQTQIKSAIEDLYIKQQKGATALLKGIYEDTYYRNIYELHKGLGIGVNFAKLDKNSTEKAVAEPWHGDNYSSRIWNNKEKLAMELQINLTQALIRGDSIDKTSKIIADRMNVARNRAITLVSTESAYITSKSTFDSYIGSGVVKQYEILATLDLRTSTICRWMDGKVFKVSEKEIGINAPPFHPRCRTTTVAYFPDAVDEERIARDYEGKTYKVDGNMDYEQWYNKYVKGNSKEEIAEKKLQNKASDKKQHENYREVLGKDIPKSFDKFQELKYNNVNEWQEIKAFVDAKINSRISPDATLKQWKNISKEVNDKIVGITTPNGIKISGLSHHGIERFIGDGQKRIGVSVENASEALLNPLDIKDVKTDNLGRKSQKFIGEKATISINPETGNIIQTNPTSSKLAERLKRRIEDDKTK